MKVIQEPTLEYNGKRGEYICLCSDGKLRTLKELARMHGIRPATLYERFRRQYRAWAKDNFLDKRQSHPNQRR